VRFERRYIACDEPKILLIARCCTALSGVFLVI